MTSCQALDDIFSGQRLRQRREQPLRRPGGALWRDGVFPDRSDRPHQVTRGPPVQLCRERFEELVADALDEIPEHLGKLMDNVAVFVEDWPTPEQLPRGGGTLLGLYQGVDLTRRSPLSYAGAMPDRITIFQGPISRLSGNEAQLKDLVRTTVVHEVAHHFGISDERLHELGW